MRGDTVQVIDAVVLVVVIVGVFVIFRFVQRFDFRSAMCDRCGRHLLRFGGGCSTCSVD